MPTTRPMRVLPGLFRRTLRSNLELSNTQTQEAQTRHKGQMDGSLHQGCKGGDPGRV